jgi:hypothetical protein
MKKITKRYRLVLYKISLSLFVILLVIFSACSSMKVTSDYDKNVDFGQFHTFSFTQSVDHSRIKSVNKDLIVSAVSREMGARGYRKSGSLSVDLWVDLFIAFDKTIKTTQSNDQIVGMRPYRYGGGFSNSLVDQHSFVEGTLVIDVIDGKSNEIIWEGRVKTTIRDEQPDKAKEKLIDDAVTRVFEKYPIGITTEK